MTNKPYASNPEILDAWEMAGFKLSKKRPCLHVLAEVKCPVPREDWWQIFRDRDRWPVCMPAVEDHTSVWNANGRVSAIVTQPYGLGEDDLGQIHRLCKELGLKVEISTKWNWHFPGVVSVVFTRG